MVTKDWYYWFPFFKNVCRKLIFYYQNFYQEINYHSYKSEDRF
jgi:hypothetical protein